MMAGFLSLANLAAEARKYVSLFGSDKMHFKAALAGVLAGMSVGIWTPNRVGEVVGRINSAPRQHRYTAAKATVLGSFLQGTCTLIFGLIGLWSFQHLPFSIPFKSAEIVTVAVIVPLIVAVLFLRYRRDFFNWGLTPEKFFNGLLWALGRYAIFCTQFVLLLYAFGFQGSTSTAFAGVSLLYLVQSYVPGSFLSELGVREVLSIFLFGSLFADPVGAPLAAFFLWVFNIGIPVALRTISAKLQGERKS
jgi:hypothetical protein